MSSAGVAVVGMACVFPGAPDLETYWRNLRDGVDAITDAPADRIEPVFFDAEADTPDRLYCRRGGFIGDYAVFDPLPFGIMPAAAEGAEPDQLLTLRIAAEALADAGYADRDFARDRAGVIVGRGNYIGAAQLRLEQVVRGAQQVVECLRTLVPNVGERELDDVRRAFQARFGSYGPDTAIGLVPNLTASRVANRLDLHGPAYTVDAACASALIAIANACDQLEAGAVDVCLAGGVHLVQDPCFWSVFSQLGALSRSDTIRPFDRRADGLLIGEGIGLVVLKRLPDAERDGDRVYCIVRGTGVASDGRGGTLMNPAVEGQVAALERAWRSAGLDPATIGLVEAHGTATPAGDAAELETLARFFGRANGAPRAGLGSVKSMIGHAMPAAGAAGFIKAALAVHHGLLPPTLGCDEPHPGFEATRFRPLREAEPWEGARRAGVNAFGFGGINAHVIIEATRSGASRQRSAVPAAGRRPALFGAASQAELLTALERGVAGGEGAWRVAVAEPSRERLELARAAVEAGRPRRGRDGISFCPPGTGLLADGKLAFLFPGVEAEFEPRVDDVSAHFGLPAPAVDARDLVHRALAVTLVSRTLDAALRRCGVVPDAVAGHSVGEWTAMIAASMLAAERADAFVAAADPSSLEMPGHVFAAAGCSAERAAEIVAGLDDVSVALDNCPHQTVLCGPAERIDEAVARLRAARVLAHTVPFPHGGFHHPAFAAYLGPHRARFESFGLQPPAVPLWSATTCAPFPDDPAAMVELATRHLAEPVRFRELLLALYEDGVRVFVQVGTGNLVGFVDDTLGGRLHLALAANAPQRSGLDQLRRVLAALWAEGARVDLAAAGLEAPASRAPLPLGVPLVRLEGPALTSAARRPAAARGGSPVLAELDATMRELEQTQDALLEALAAPGRTPAAPPPVSPLVERRTFSADSDPYLLDHCLFFQPPGWPHPEDRYPVVPIAMSMELMLELASRAAGRRASALENVHAATWLAVTPPADVTMRVTPRHDGSAAIALEGYVEGLARFDEPGAPVPDRAPLRNERREIWEHDDMYGARWLFHGPAYQGVVRIHAVADDGMRATVRVLPSPGALIDAAGQVLGMWAFRTATVDWLALPYRVDRLETWEPLPPPGTLVECVVRIRESGPRLVRGDIEIVWDGRLCLRVTGWQDVRFESDHRMWSVMIHPEHCLLAEPQPDGCVLVPHARRAPWSEDYLARRYLSGAERARLDEVPAGRRLRTLYGRVAAKDAVRHLLFSLGHPALYPVEIGIEHGPGGRPLVTGPFEEDVRVSLAHTGDMSVALAAVGTDPGIDVERIEPRDDGFVRLAFADQELRLVPPGADRDEWLTRFWCAKEAAGKARGTGLGGDPRSLAATALDGERVRVGDRWVETRRRGDHTIAWIR